MLFNPAPRVGWQAQRRIETPLSLLSIASPVHRQGYKVKIIDQFADPDWETEFSKALETKPLCFGITCMTGPQILRALEACRTVRELYPDVPIIWGGIHASLLPAQTLSNPYVDIVVVGEGEETFEELVNALESGASLDRVAGIYYKEGNKIRSTPSRPFIDLDKQPPLSYHLVNMDLYRRYLFNVDHMSVNTSRGCLFRCSFCWDPVLHKRQWRAMQPKTVLEHLKLLIRDFGIKGFNFTDDHFFIDMKRAYGIMEEIVKADLNITIGHLHIRADTICRMDKEFLELIVRAGVKRFTLGIESGSQRILDLIKKDLRIEQVIEASRRLRPYPIVPVYLFMMGLPTETPDELSESIRLAEKLVEENPLACKTFNIYTPYPGTELFNVAVEHGLKVPEKLEDWARFNYRNIPRESAWVPEETKKLILGLDFPLMFIGDGHFVNPYKQTNPLVVGLAKLYKPIAKYRVKNLDARFPIESKVVKSLGLFARQD